MGQAKKQWEDEIQQRQHQEMVNKVAKHMGFNPADVDASKIEISKNDGSKGDNNYGWDVYFPKDAPEAIRAKLDKDGTYSLNPTFFEDEEYDDEDNPATFGDMGPGSIGRTVADDYVRKNREDKEKNTGNS